MNVKSIPDGYHTATPYLIVQGAAQALEFYKQAFDAEVTVRMDGPDGKVGHAEIRIGDAMIMLADEHPHMGFRSPKTLGGTPVSILLYVDDVDVRVRRAVECGAQVTRPSMTGRLLVNLADRFFVQWPELVEAYRGRAVYRGSLVDETPAAAAAGISHRRTGI